MSSILRCRGHGGFTTGSGLGKVGNLDPTFSAARKISGRANGNLSGDYRPLQGN